MILTSNKVDFRARYITEDGKEHYIVTKKLIH